MADLSECPLRLALSEAVVKAMAATYKDKAELDAARIRKDSDLGPYRSALGTARLQVRRAQRQLREHIKQHGCYAASLPA
jgi:hypothetical protein